MHPARLTILLQAVFPGLLGSTRSLTRSCLLAVCSVSLLTGATLPAEQPVSFTNDVMPVLSKAGCNIGVCHAKAGNGQNGFQLSLLGFEPDDDYDNLVKDGRARRLFTAAPDRSLLLLKGSGRVPHGGGVRLPADSEGYRILHDWIAQGMPNDRGQAVELVKFEVQPSTGKIPLQGELQLKALAHYADGSVRDVTEMALYESNDPAMAEVDESGHVNVLDLAGRVAIMVRYQGNFAVYNGMIPLGAPVEQVPTPKNFVDEYVFANLKELGIPPSPVCDDATFLRRVTLDISGRLPTRDEVAEFLQSSDENKRDQVIEQLLRSPDYADFFAGKWSALLKNRRENASDMPVNFAFHAWVRDSLLENKPYDRFVRELLAATGSALGNPPVAWYKRVKEPNQQIEDIAQLFLGVRMQCAQCHHHPFERWSQDDYYSLVAFFSQVGRKPSGIRNEDLIFHQRGIATAKNIKTEQELRPAALGDVIPPIAPDEDPRLKLADWMGQPENPFFAKALVNRYWKHFFRRGLIEPEDDIRDSNPPTNPELLAALEQHFISSGFDLKDLIRIITQSRAYQLSSEPNEHNQLDHQNYSRYYPRRLPAEVLLDSIDHVTGSQTDFPNLPTGTRAIALPDNSYNRSSPFLRVFGRPEAESVCECERVQSSSLAQSLHLINAQEIKTKLAHAQGRAEQLAKSEATHEEKVRELYLAALAREPRPEELAIALEYLAEVPLGANDQPIDPNTALRQNLQDLIWALLNTKEFLFNH